MNARVCRFSDKAYIASDHCISQIKKQPGHELEEELRLYNDVCSMWVNEMVWEECQGWGREAGEHVDEHPAKAAERERERERESERERMTAS
jgi:hypothetical protein